MIESTRRLLYVGCTRAKANLYILYNEKILLFLYMNYKNK